MQMGAAFIADLHEHQSTMLKETRSAGPTPFPTIIAFLCMLK